MKLHKRHAIVLVRGARGTCRRVVRDRRRGSRKFDESLNGSQEPPYGLDRRERHLQGRALE